MAFWIDGWIEINPWPDVEDNQLWFGAVDLGSLVDVADEDSEQLFGLSKACVCGEKVFVSYAAGRGVPAIHSRQVRQDLAAIAAHEEKFGKGEFGGYTYALWSEIGRYSLRVPPEESEWKLPFELARALEARYGAECVRFVVWFCW